MASSTWAISSSVCFWIWKAIACLRPAWADTTIYGILHRKYQRASFFPHKRPLLISLDLGTGQLPHRRVMHGPGVRPSHHGVARHRAPRMARQARSAPNPTALLQVGYDLLDLDSGQSSLLQRRGPALAERFATPCAAHQANLLPALAPVHPELAALGRPLAKGGTGRIRTGELRQLPLERSFCLFHAPRTTRKLPFVHLSPATRHYPPFYLFILGHSYYLMGRYEEAIAAYKKALTRNSNFLPAHAFLATICSGL